MPATMGDRPAPAQRVTVAEAATALGLSVEHVRRLVREGALKGERVQRGRGWSWLVTLGEPPAVERPDTGIEPRPRVVEPATVPEPDATAAMLSAFGRAIAPLMTPLVAQLVDQAETIGRLRAEAAFRRAPRQQVRRRPARGTRAATGGV